MTDERDLVPWALDEGDLTPEQQLQSLQKLGTSLSTAATSGGLPFINPDKGTGIWCYGAERIEVEQGSEWILNPREIKHGYRAWVDGTLKAERMVSGFEDCPTPQSLGEWASYATLGYSVPLLCLTGEDKGLQCIYATNSAGGHEFFAEFYKGIKTHIKTPFPVVHLETSFYQHKTYGRIYKPLFKPLRWLDTAALKALASRQVDAGRAPEKPAAQPAAGVDAAAEKAERARATRARPGRAAPSQPDPVKAEPVRRRRVAS